MPLISVIIPVYNVEKYLRRCLDSVVNQTFRDLEIICVNDGTKDGSVAILEEYAAKDKRMKIIHKKNGGLSSARNEGLKNAAGKYIGFVDGDDWIEPDTYERAYRVMQDYNVDLVCYYVKVELDDFSLEDDIVINAKNYHAIKVIGVQNITNELLLNTTVCAWNKLYRKSIIDRWNIIFPTGLLHEDIEFFCKYAVMCSSVYYIDMYLYHYVQRKNSICGKIAMFVSPKTTDRLRVCYNVYLYYVQHSLLPSYSLFFSTLFFWSFEEEYFKTKVENRQRVLQYATKTVKKMNLSLLDDSHNIFYNLMHRKYQSIPCLNNSVYLSNGLVMAIVSRPYLIVFILGIPFKLNYVRIRNIKKNKTKYRLDELTNRIENIDNRINESLEKTNKLAGITSQRMDATDIHIGKMDRQLNDTNNRIGQVNYWLNETNKWVEGTNQRIDNTNKQLNETNKWVEKRLNRSQIIHERLITDYVKEYKDKILSKTFMGTKNTKEYLPFHYNQDIAVHLKSLPYFIFCPNNGNLGDIIIAAAEYQYFKYLGCNYSVFDMYSQTLPESGPIDFVYGGGGIFVKYCNYQNVLEILKLPNLRSVIILPSSFFECPDVLEVFDERFTVFCREKRSYDYCKSLNTRAEFILSGDMAFNLDIADIKNSISPNIKRNIESLNEIYLNKVYESYSFYMSIRIKIIQAFLENTIVLDSGIRAAYLLRADAESKDKTSDAAAFLPKRIDLSGFTWTSCADPGVVKLLSALFIDAINTIDVVVTDRLHIGIASAMLGKRVYLLDNIYGKVSAVYEHSMKDFENVCFLESLDAFSLENIDATGTNVDLSLFETDKTFAGYFKEYCSVDQMNDVITDSIFTY
ncbi:MAG: glycosyltransferase [Bacteroidales bacterium]|jgi:glycosyltransferase involved in cell wall biosynthesis/exopolysaccharide biosynthesis predicted pyruvyltransferase EpsI|nr:glycosyltransferase [Bacteroidales bacterium]